MADMHLTTIVQMTKMLRQLDAWLEKAAAFAEGRSGDADALVSARLIFDQYPLMQQIQAACDTAKLAASRLSGKEAPSHPDDETTFEQARARIASTLTFLDSVGADDFAGADERVIRLSFLPEGKGVAAKPYLTGFATPNFYFHLTTAYAILRSNGVELGKRDYIGGFELIDV